MRLSFAFPSVIVLLVLGVSAPLFAHGHGGGASGGHHTGGGHSAGGGFSARGSATGQSSQSKSGPASGLNTSGGGGTGTASRSSIRTSSLNSVTNNGGGIGSLNSYSSGTTSGNNSLSNGSIDQLANLSPQQIRELEELIRKHQQAVNGTGHQPQQRLGISGGKHAGSHTASSAKR